MSTLELHVDVDVPVDAAWETLHRVENYPRFVEGVQDARTEAGGRAHLEVEAGGRAQQVEAEVTDRGERVMEWLTTAGPDLTGSFSVQAIDRNHTRIQARLEYDPDTVRAAFGGPKGFAQTNAIQRLVRSDLEHFKEYVEGG
ncbi:SRPBCC family protein [Streptomyces sp. FXJ1.172]|uniref:SRPBCC family protein n=1 Tax=Streptomyces sp. FXJ1.172 TaxID=710705 RepID=UPI0007CFED29|nr:SRPBCC family protein [Streptomyces sp. FXJ1.172]WEO94261.1 SRPBCC family protein [Streptomyces sp. FXJ1.172]